MKVLLIEDDYAIAGDIEHALAGEGIVTDRAESGEDGLNFSKVYVYDLIILDIGLPDIDGFKLLQKLRAMRIDVPVLILSGMGESEKKVQGLGLGADDYLTKPFNIHELIARIKAVIRRSKGHADNEIIVGDLVIDFDRHTTTIDGTPVHLTFKEQEMLEFMALKKNSAINKESFLNHLYNGMDEPDLKIIDVFVCKMRKKLSEVSGGKNYIETLWGRGYALRDPNEGITTSLTVNAEGKMVEQK